MMAPFFYHTCLYPESQSKKMLKQSAMVLLPFRQPLKRIIQQSGRNALEQSLSAGLLSIDFNESQ